jgi:hypothetical protein
MTYYALSRTEALMKNTRFSVLISGLVAGIAICVTAGSASAQPLVKGTFTLANEVRWGKAVLPAGHYSITVDGADRPALVSTLTGRRVAYVMARTFDDAVKGQPTALIVTNVENQRVVRSFNWREGNRNFIYRAFTRAERKQVERAGEMETVTIRMAQK